MIEDTVTTGEAAKILGLQTTETLLRRIRAGSLPAEKVGKAYRIRRSEVEHLKRRLQHKRSSPSHVERRVELARDRFRPVGT
jgi:excisionase family DNA binding protein